MNPSSLLLTFATAAAAPPRALRGAFANMLAATEYGERPRETLSPLYMLLAAVGVVMAVVMYIWFARRAPHPRREAPAAALPNAAEECIKAAALIDSLPEMDIVATDSDAEPSPEQRDAVLQHAAPILSLVTDVPLNAPCDWRLEPADDLMPQLGFLMPIRRLGRLLMLYASSAPTPALAADTLLHILALSRNLERIDHRVAIGLAGDIAAPAAKALTAIIRSAPIELLHAIHDGLFKVGAHPAPQGATPPAGQAAAEVEHPTLVDALARLVESMLSAHSASNPAAPAADELASGNQGSAAPIVATGSALPPGPTAPATAPPGEAL